MTPPHRATGETSGLAGFAVDATDGVIGHVRDFYFDDEAWVIRYGVVDTGGWLSGRKVLVSPMAFGTPDWGEKLLPVSISRERVRNSPDIDTDRPVSRLLIDGQTWAIRYLIVDTSNWWLGHQVLIAPPWVEAVRWFDESVTVAMTRRAIRDAPEYDPRAGLSRQEEERLHQHFGQSGYWTDHPLRATEISRV